MKRTRWTALLSLSFSSLLIATMSCGPGDDQPPVREHVSATDPVGFDPAFPPQMHEITFRSHGSTLNAIMYGAAGPGPHPTVVFLHGYPGNERNLDLAQAVRRAGMNALYFNYRGSWGSGGGFSLGHTIEDAAAAVAFLRDAEAAATYRVDPTKIALVGHSTGGFAAAIAASEDPSISCIGFLAGANFGAWGHVSGADEQVRAGFTAALGASMDPDSGPIDADPVDVVQEMIDRADEFDVTARAEALSARPIFMAIGSRDETVPKSEHHDPMLTALREAGASRVTEVVLDDGHSFSAHRMELSRRLVDWTRDECWK